MATLKKYKKPEIEIVSIGKDIIVTSITGSGDGGTDPWPGEDGNSSISRMNPLDRPLGIFKRD